MKSALRVALFTDSFHEANGVATVSQQFAAFAKRQGIPFCLVHGGNQTRATRDGTVELLELKRSFASFPLDSDLSCDLLLSRHRNRAIRHVAAFRPDLIHIMGPGDVGVLGFWVSNYLSVPMVASWHTNLHEYAARRIHNALQATPKGTREKIARFTERQSLRALTAFYRIAHFVLAPNPAMTELLRERTGRLAYVMAHGVDAERFHPEPRDRTGNCFCIGYVGRLTPEKNVRAFVELERQLLNAGQRNFRFLLIGEGREREWLERNLQFGDLPGILRGDALARAYAAMNAFVFPSRTDTFGLVILEAMAAGVPVVTSPATGANVGLKNGVNAFLAEDFADSVLRLMRDPALCCSMACAARQFACAKAWPRVFEDLFEIYEAALPTPQVRSRIKSIPTFARLA